VFVTLIYSVISVEIIVPAFDACSSYAGTGPVTKFINATLSYTFASDFSMEPGWDAYDYMMIWVTNKQPRRNITLLVNSIEITPDMGYSRMSEREKIALYEANAPTTSQYSHSKRFTTDNDYLELSRREFKDNLPFFVYRVYSPQDGNITLTVTSGTKGIPCSSRIFFLVYGVPLISLFCCNFLCLMSIVSCLVVYYRCVKRKDTAYYNVPELNDNDEGGMEIEQI
jgi:hypothetical protein